MEPSDGDCFHSSLVSDDRGRQCSIPEDRGPEPIVDHQASTQDCAPNGLEADSEAQAPVALNHERQKPGVNRDYLRRSAAPRKASNAYGSTVRSTGSEKLTSAEIIPHSRCLLPLGRQISPNIISDMTTTKRQFLESPNINPSPTMDTYGQLEQVMDSLFEKMDHRLEGVVTAFSAALVHILSSPTMVRNQERPHRL